MKSGTWLSRERVLGYSAVCLAVEIAAFMFCVLVTHGLISLPAYDQAAHHLAKPNTTDFVSFYAAGALADSGTPALAYDQAAHHAAEQAATAPGIGYVYFFYPPVFLLICAALAHLPYLAAFVVFQALTLSLFIAVARSTLRDPDWKALLPVLAFPSVLWTIGFGQNSFLTAALFGGALLLIDRKPIVAGILFGCLCYKPHFGLLVPIALAAAGRWRAFIAAAASASLIVGLSILVFGWITWQNFLAVGFGSHTTYESGQVDFAAFVSAFGAVRLLGGSATLAYLVQAPVALVAALAVALAWRRELSLPIRAAILASATLVTIPLALYYDLVLGAVAAMWLVVAARQSGYFAWEKTGLMALFLVPLLPRQIGAATHVPVAAIGVFVLFALALMHAWRELAQRAATPGPAASVEVA